MSGLDKAKLVTADILGQATAMGVHLNNEDAEARDKIIKDVVESQREEPSIENPIDVDEIPDPESAAERVVREAETASKDKFFEPELPEELDEELNAPDFEAMAEEELYSEPEPPTPTFEDNSYQMVPTDEAWEELDQDVIEERKKRIAAEKKAAWYEERNLRTAQKQWGAEARKYFPLSGSALDNGHITAKSRKDFLRQAKRAHEAVLPYIKEAIKSRDATLDAERQRAKEETRAEMIRAWGRPTTGPNSYPTRNDYADELADSRRKGDLARSIGILRKRAQGGDDE